MNLSCSFSNTSAFSIVPFHVKLKILSLSSTLSANHSCNPAGEARKSNKITGEHLTGNSKVYNCFAILFIHYLVSNSCNNKKLISPSKYFPYYFSQNPCLLMWRENKPTNASLIPYQRIFWTYRLFD